MRPFKVKINTVLIFFKRELFWTFSFFPFGILLKFFSPFFSFFSVQREVVQSILLLCEFSCEFFFQFMVLNHCEIRHPWHCCHWKPLRQVASRFHALMTQGWINIFVFWIFSHHFIAGCSRNKENNCTNACQASRRHDSTPVKAVPRLSMAEYMLVVETPDQNGSVCWSWVAGSKSWVVGSKSWVVGPKSWVVGSKSWVVGRGLLIGRDLHLREDGFSGCLPFQDKLLEVYNNK